MHKMISAEFLSYVPLITCAFIYLKSKHQIARLNFALNDMKSRYRRQYGWHFWYGIYDIESFDGGISWYAMEDVVGERVVLGPSEVFYPGLVEELQHSAGEKITNFNQSAIGNNDNRQSPKDQVVAHNLANLTGIVEATAFASKKKQSQCMRLQTLPALSRFSLCAP